MITHDDQTLIEQLMGKTTLTDNVKAESYAYMSNPDGTIRWIYPTHLKKPTFLNFYSTSSFRAKVLSSLIRLAFFMKQSHRVKSGDLNLTIADDSPLGNILKACTYTGFSIFTGTVGENRKAVVEIHNNDDLFMFVKIALTKTAQTLIQNEAKILEHLATHDFKALVIPKLLSNNEQDTIGLSNIKPKHFKQDSHLTNVHVNVLSELYNITPSQKEWPDLKVFQESKSILHDLLKDYEELNDLKKSRVHVLASKLVQLSTLLEESGEKTTVAIAHGDFTPWNMYRTDSTVHLFDWELSQDEMPLLYDLFHFVFQSEIMIKHSDYTVIYREIVKVMGLESAQIVRSAFNVELSTNYMFYLLYTITYYLNKYIKQQDLHEQVFWLMDIWEEAVDDVIAKKGVLFEK